MVVFELPDSRLPGNTLEAGMSKLPMYRHIGKLKEKWSHSDNKILWECYVRYIKPSKSSSMKNTYDLWIQGGMREIPSQN